MVFLKLSFRREDGTSVVAKGLTRVDAGLTLQDALATVFARELGFPGADAAALAVCPADPCSGSDPQPGSAALDPSATLAALRLRNGAMLVVLPKSLAPASAAATTTAAELDTCSVCSEDVVELPVPSRSPSPWPQTHATAAMQPPQQQQQQQLEALLAAVASATERAKDLIERLEAKEDALERLVERAEAVASRLEAAHQQQHPSASTPAASAAPARHSPPAKVPPVPLTPKATTPRTSTPSSTTTTTTTPLSARSSGVKPPLPSAATGRTKKRHSVASLPPPVVSPSGSSLAAHVTFIASDGTQFQLSAQLAYQCGACHPPKKMFSFPHISASMLRAVVLFLEKPASPSLPDAVRQAVPRKLLRAASGLQLPGLVVLAASIALAEEQPDALAERLVSTSQWLLSRPVSEMLALEADISSKSLATDPSSALDLLWFARCLAEKLQGRDKHTYLSSQGRWKSVYSESRVQTALLSSVATDEEDLAILGPFVEHLDLSGSPSVNDSSVGLVLKLCPSLQTLDLHDCSGVGAPSAEALAEARPPLQSLQISGTAIPAEAFDALHKAFPGKF